MVYLIGASGHAKVILEILEQQGVQIGCLVDANPNATALFDYSVESQFPQTFDIKTDSIILSIGNNRTRKRLSNSRSYQFFTAVHQSANISPRSILGMGTVVMAGATINSGVIIGDHVILNTNSSVDHDCFISDYVHISPNAALAGNVYVGEGTHIGIGSCIVQGIKIGKWSTIGAGAVIINDVPDYAVVVGAPGKIIKYNSEDEG